MTWCTDFGGPALGFARTTDFKTVIAMENIRTPYTRNGAPFPRKIDGDNLLLTRPSDTVRTAFGDIFRSPSKDPIRRGVPPPRDDVGVGLAGATKIGAGAPPIETPAGWLMFYHGVQNTANGFVYSFGAPPLDLENSDIVRYRTNAYTHMPMGYHEKNVFVPSVTFPRAVRHDPDPDRIPIFYGSADTYTAAAYGHVLEIVEHTTKDSLIGPGDDLEYRG